MTGRGPLALAGTARDWTVASVQYVVGCANPQIMVAETQTQRFRKHNRCRRRTRRAGPCCRTCTSCRTRTMCQGSRWGSNRRRLRRTSWRSGIRRSPVSIATRGHGRGQASGASDALTPCSQERVKMARGALQAAPCWIHWIKQVFAPWTL